MKSTPGPWEVRKQKDRGIGPRGSHLEILHPLINTEGEYKGQLGGYHVVIGNKNCEDGYILTEANAYLMAASPKLLHACEMALNVFASKENITEEQRDIMQIHLRDAISAAEGRG